MALLPTTHLRPTSLSGLHSPHIPFLLLRRHCSNIARKSPPFQPILAQAPHPPPRSQPAPVPNSTDDSSPDYRWLGTWKKDDRLRKLPKKPRAAVDYRGTDVYDDENEVGTSRSTGSSTMEKIVEKLKRFGYVDGVGERKERPLPERGSVEDIFYTEDGVLPNSRGGLLSDSDEEVRFPWEKPKSPFGDGEGAERRKSSKTSLAELTLPEGELRRLRHLAIRTKSKMKIGGAGATKEIVDKIHERWMMEEVVRLKCEGPAALNMKRMHEILERKTGGLVIWRSGSSLSLYRGVNYELSQPANNWNSHANGVHMISKGSAFKFIDHSRESSYIQNMRALKQDESILVKQAKDPDPLDIKYEHEIDKLLDDLGPRYMDWAGCEPLPVDADLLPGVVPDYMPPFRILPYGLRPHLGMKDQTRIRRLARVLPPHFALGRSRQHQGLAAAMVKLWEKSLIAKIALKRGVQLTSSERMAEDIKKLTGGTLLCRNKDYIVFYRGKDFLTPELSEALVEREKLAKGLQDEEEKARLKASSLVFSNIEMTDEPRIAGTLGETQDADARWAKKLDNDYENKIMKAADMARHADLVRKLERKLFQAQHKLLKAEKALGKVEEFLKPTEHKADLESITEEERFMFRKLGLKMKAFLLLGRRGVFDGTVENMHLHWKYRELVKIIVKAKTFSQVRNVALSLEAESGGVLVSVDKISKGFAIVVYRGKDYQRPAMLRPKNLLTKRKALARSIELQRREALCHHISNIEKRVEKLRCELEQMDAVKEQGDEELYDKLDSIYLSEDENTEDLGDEAYFETLQSDAEDSTSRDDESEGECDS